VTEFSAPVEVASVALRSVTSLRPCGWLLTFWRKALLSSGGKKLPKMEAVDSSETFVTIYKITRRQRS
jgi:hypothetical protein